MILKIINKYCNALITHSNLQVLAKYDAKMFQRFQRVFEWLPVSHCVNQSILVMHGGIPCSSGPYLGTAYFLIIVNRHQIYIFWILLFGARIITPYHFNILTLKLYIFSTAKQDTTLKSRKISFDCETHSLNNDKCVSDNNSTSGGLEVVQEEEENIPSLDDIRDLRRGRQVPREGLMCDLLWADPQVSISYAIN